MLPLLFDPLLPLLSLTLALLAIPIGVAIQRRRGRLARDVTARQICRGVGLNVAGLTGLLLFGLILERASAATLMRTGHGAGLGDPMSWLGAATSLVAGSAWMVWQLGLLLGPIGLTLAWLQRATPRSWMLRPGMLRLGVVLVGPLVAAPLVHLLPMQRAPTVLLAALVLWVCITAVLFVGRARQPAPLQPASLQPVPFQPAQHLKEPSPRPVMAMTVVRTPERAESTVISLLPAALARDINPQRPPLPPALAQATQRRARRRVKPGVASRRRA